MPGSVASGTSRTLWVTLIVSVFQPIDFTCKTVFFIEAIVLCFAIIQ